MATRVVLGVFMAALTLAVAACGGDAPPPESQSQTPSAAPAADASHTQHAGGRVFFVAPKNGDTIKTLSKFEFGSDQFTIAPVPAGEVKEARAGLGHFHLGVDTDCLPAGTEIPKADPWIHFGKGDRTIEMQLKPGQHRLAVQVGDDLHRTIEGLCETITVNVVE
jgi:hypothetical protein